MKKERVTKPTIETVNAEVSQDGDVTHEKFEQTPVEEKKVVFDSDTGVGFVEVGLSVTLKLSQRYEMARVEVKVRKPCKPGSEDATYDEIRDFCAERLRAQWRAIRGEAKKEVQVRNGR